MQSIAIILSLAKKKLTTTSKYFEEILKSEISITNVLAIYFMQLILEKYILQIVHNYTNNT